MTAPELAYNKRGLARHYKHPATGVEVPSITNVIGVLDKPALPRWAAKMTAETAWKMRHSLDAMGEAEAVQVLKGSPWRSSGRSAYRGTDVHGWLEAKAKEEDPDDLTGEAASYQAAAQGFLDLYRPKFIDTEFTVFGAGYAGTADAAAVIGDRLYAVDYKTSKALYPEVALQLAAVVSASDLVSWSGDVILNYPFDGALAVRIGAGGALEVAEVIDIGAACEAFMACLSAWEWKADAGKKPLSPFLVDAEVPA